MTSEQICFVVAITVLSVLESVRHYFAQRRIDRLREQRDKWMGHAFTLYDLIKTQIPNISEQAQQVLEEERKKRAELSKNWSN